MKHSFKLVLAGAVLLAMNVAANAETGKMYIPPKPVPGSAYQSVVRDTNGKPVRDTNGNCVRTNWSADCDECAPQAGIPLAERTVYFDFNRSKLTKEARKKLDALVGKMMMHGPIKSVRIAGYADRLGNPVYNEKLSKRRAETVRKYLEAQGVANALVTQTRWFGETVPATQCPKGLKRKELIKCLAKDRRVEVEVEFGLPGMMPIPPAVKTHQYKVKKHKAMKKPVAKKDGMNMEKPKAKK